MEPSLTMKSSHFFLLLPVALSLALTTAAHASNVIVNVNYLPSGTGTFIYSISVTNNLPDDLALVSLIDGPTFDSLIQPSLTSPAGFFASYDSNLGFVDLIEGSSAFTSGSTTGLFTFESMAAPGSAFTMFEAFDVNGGTVTGMTNLVPEPASTGLVAFAALPLLLRRRRVA